MNSDAWPPGKKIPHSANSIMSQWAASCRNTPGVFLLRCFLFQISDEREWFWFFLRFGTTGLSPATTSSEMEVMFQNMLVKNFDISRMHLNYITWVLNLADASEHPPPPDVVNGVSQGIILFQRLFLKRNIWNATSAPPVFGFLLARPCKSPDCLEFAVYFPSL